MPEETHVAKDSQGNEGFYDPVSKQAYINGILYKIFYVSTEGRIEHRCRVTSSFSIPHTKDIVLDYIEIDGERYDVAYLVDLAFSDCDQLESVVLGDSIYMIGFGAFRFCPNLKKFVSGSSVDFIPDNCFTGDYALADVQLGKGVRKIMDNGFNSCCSLESIVLPENLSYIGECAFNGCSSLKKMVLPQYVCALHHSAFACCNSLEELTIEASGSFSICDDALSGCHNLKTIYSSTQREKIDVFDCKKSAGLSGPTHHEEGSYPWDYQNATFIYTGKADSNTDEHYVAVDGGE